MICLNCSRWQCHFLFIFQLKNDIHNDVPACTLMYFGFTTDSTRYGTPDNNNNLPPVSPQFQFWESCQTTRAATLTDQIIQDSLP